MYVNERKVISKDLLKVSEPDEAMDDDEIILGWAGNLSWNLVCMYI